MALFMFGQENIYNARNLPGITFTHQIKMVGPLDPPDTGMGNKGGGFTGAACGIIGEYLLIAGGVVGAVNEMTDRIERIFVAG